MNYLPYCGYWFYDAGSDDAMYLAFVSWGLILAVPGAPVAPSTKRRVGLMLGVY